MNIEKGKNTQEPQMVELYHNLGKMPDRYYYQLNRKSAQENYADQKNQIIETNDDSYEVHFTSEVKIKR